MKKFLLAIFIALPFMFMSCSSDDDAVDPDGGGDEFEGETKSFDLFSVADPSISGTATFMENEDNSTTVEIELDGTPDGGMHPAHIHYNTAAEGGDIALSFEPVDGSTGMSTTTFSTLDDGTGITYEEAINFDGYINVHLSADDLGTLVAQGDIGENELTGESKNYMLEEKDVEGISGNVMFQERVNGEALATIMLDGTPEDGEHPAHIHMGSVAEAPGDIAFSFNPVNGATGMSKTNVAALDDGTAFMYNDVLSYDGYVNVHLSADELGTIVAQNDIGGNELTGESKSYDLDERDVEGISGTVMFEERMSGAALATINIENTPEDGMHPAHIHMGSFTEGPGDIAFTFNPVNGATGMSMTQVEMLDDDTAFGYEEVLNYDGYVNVHLSADELGVVVAQGDIGANELTGESKTYELGEKDVEGISGSVIFEERMSGEALATIMLDGTPEDGMHPAHIHMGTAAEGPGDIAFTFNPVNGATGMSMTHVGMLDDDTEFGYEDVLNYDGYVNVHLSADQLGVIVAQGDIGQNELTGESASYDLASVDVAGIMGTAMFEERVNGETLVTIMLDGTPDGGEHPAHIHVGSIADAPGDIAISLNSVDGDTGMSMTNVSAFDGEDGDMIDYNGLLEYNGYLNVHLSAEDLDTLVAQGNVGSNS
ncbi:CHRD domain-containing protein [Salegentibacter sp. Hel_I_6]|uniref:CHRD domain-containing protein n=1 Tax=Salegentibacter sp. Hel_I_6 TaxID=1250278 RepID=UPI000A8A479B|nr:CHRD domain-containing protein [Salegentibacter sp. Hel_I_6]